MGEGDVMELVSTRIHRHDSGKYMIHVCMSLVFAHEMLSLTVWCRLVLARVETVYGASCLWLTLRLPDAQDFRFVCFIRVIARD